MNADELRGAAGGRRAELAGVTSDHRGGHCTRVAVAEMKGAAPSVGDDGVVSPAPTARRGARQSLQTTVSVISFTSVNVPGTRLCREGKRKRVPKTRSQESVVALVLVAVSEDGACDTSWGQDAAGQDKGRTVVCHLPAIL